VDSNPVAGLPVEGAVQRLADRWSSALIAPLVDPRVAARTFTLTESGDVVGSLRVVDGALGDSAALVRVVDTRLTIAHLGIDSVMLHAFSPSSSTSPHLLSDLAELTTDGRTEWHFHVDLMPRIDLVSSPDQIDATYTPLTASYESVHAIEGMRPITIPPQLRALSSGWLIGAIVRPSNAPSIDAVFADYSQRWRFLVAQPPKLARATDPLVQAERDRTHRATLFDPTTDIVWEFLADLIGQDDVDAVIAAVKGEG